MSIGLGFLIFLIGVLVGMKLIDRGWRHNAKDYKGKDGFKVIHLSFYDMNMSENYMRYLIERKQKTNKWRKGGGYNGC